MGDEFEGADEELLGNISIGSAISFRFWNGLNTSPFHLMRLPRPAKDNNLCTF